MLPICYYVKNLKTQEELQLRTQTAKDVVICDPKYSTGDGTMKMSALLTLLGKNKCLCAQDSFYSSHRTYSFYFYIFY